MNTEMFTLCLNLNNSVSVRINCDDNIALLLSAVHFCFVAFLVVSSFAFDSAMSVNLLRAGIWDVLLLLFCLE